MMISKFIKKNRYCVIPTLFLLFGCSHEDSGLLYRCSTTLLGEQLSPQKTLILSKYERNCGATTSFVTTVSIRQSGQPFKHDPNATVAMAEGKISINTEWISEGRVKIRSSSKLFKRENKFGNVDIVYEQVSK